MECNMLWISGIDTTDEKNTCRRSKMTLTTLKCMSKFLSNSTRVLRQRRQRMDLTEGTHLQIFLLIFTSAIPDILAAGQCRP